MRCTSTPARTIAAVALLIGLLAPLVCHADPIPLNDPLFSVAQGQHIDPLTYAPHAANRPPVRQRQAVAGLIAVMLAATGALTFKLASHRRRPIIQHPSRWRVDAPPMKEFQTDTIAPSWRHDSSVMDN